MEVSKEIYSPSGRNLGDCWMAISYHIHLSIEQNKILKMSHGYYKRGAFKWTKLFYELHPLFRDRHLVQIVPDHPTALRPNSGKLRKPDWIEISKYPLSPTEIQWQPNNSKKICYQFDGKAFPEKNFPSEQVQNDLLQYISSLGYEMIDIGHRMPIKECINHLSQSERFIGLDSGIMLIALCAGVPTILVQNGRNPEQLKVFHRYQRYTLALDAEHCKQMFRENNFPIREAFHRN